MKGIRERERERNSQTDEKIGRRRYEREREGGRKEETTNEEFNVFLVFLL